MKPLNNYPELLRLLELYSPAGQNYAQLILEIEEKSQLSDLIVPILGTQGMGKSTLINAVLREDILPNEADETTCVPIEVRYGEVPYGEVHFIDNRPAIIVHTKEELSLYVDNNYNRGNEKQVSHIILFRDYDLLETGLVIVDLPGVGSLTKANEETTNKYIKNLCVAVFIISTSPPVLKTEANFISTVWRRFNSAYFVQNVWDDNSKEDIDAGLLHNKKVLTEISQKINAPMLHPIIPVNAYAAAKGAFEQNLELIESSNIKEFFSVLNLFAESYREQNAAALEARIKQFIETACEQVSWRMQQAQMTGEEILAAMNQEKSHFESVTSEIEETVGKIKRQLNVDQREVQSFAAELGKKYINLLRVEVFRLIDKGIVDGERLSSAFSDYQSQYATEALNEVYEKFEQLWENLKTMFDQLDEILQQENIEFFEAKTFNKVQAFKWEKGMDAAIKIGGVAGGAYLGACIAGPWGFVAAAAISIFSGFIGSISRKEVSKARGRETKREIEPYIEKFRSDLCQVINDSYAQFSKKTLQQLNSYVAAREEQLTVIQKQIVEFKKNGMKVNQEIETLERDRQFLIKWRPDND